MNKLVSLHNSIFSKISQMEWILPTLARFTFAAVLLMYFWQSGVTKLGDGIFGIFSPSVGAYVQIFPKTMEAILYDTSQLGWFHWAVALAGTWAEFILPALILVGLFTRIAALGMIGFVIVQSLTDIYGHMATDPATLGAWFDAPSGSVIMDQRTLWVMVLLVLVVKGAGPISLDRVIGKTV